MRHGYTYKCPSCQRRYEILFDNWPASGVEVAQAARDIKDGKYGEKMQEFFQNTLNATVDARRRLFVCESCGRWSNAPDLSIWQWEYEPPPINEKDRDFYEDLYGIVPEYDDEGVPSHQVAEAGRICRKCGIRMRMYDGEDLGRPDTVRCRYCGVPCHIAETILHVMHGII